MAFSLGKPLKCGGISIFLSTEEWRLKSVSFFHLSTYFFKVPITVTAHYAQVLGHFSAMFHIEDILLGRFFNQRRHFSRSE